LHALAREVGMRQPSLYAYFDSKSALYDAMFADGNRQLLERLDAVQLPRNPRTALKKLMGAFVDFAVPRLRAQFARLALDGEGSDSGRMIAQRLGNRCALELAEAS